MAAIHVREVIPSDDQTLDSVPPGTLFMFRQGVTVYMRLAVLAAYGSKSIPYVGLKSGVIYMASPSQKIVRLSRNKMVELRNLV